MLKINKQQNKEDKMKEDKIVKELYELYNKYNNLNIKNGAYNGKYKASFNYNESIIKFDIICQLDEHGNKKKHAIRFYFNENSLDQIIHSISILENNTAVIINNTIKEILTINDSKLFAVSIDMDSNNKIRLIYIDGDFKESIEKKRWNVMFHGEENIFLTSEDEQKYIVLRHLIDNDDVYKEIVTNDLGDILPHNEKNKDEIKKYIEDYKNNEEYYISIKDMFKI